MKPKLLYSFLGFVAGISACYMFFQDPESTDLAPEETLYKAQEDANLKDVNARLLQESDALRQGNILLTGKIAQLEIQLSKYSQEKDKKDAERRKSRGSRVKYELDILKANLELTPQQEQDTEKFVRDYLQDRKRSQSQSDLEKNIISILTDEQLPIYEEHLSQIKNRNAESIALLSLGNYPTPLKLSEDQKDIIYGNLYKFSHQDTMEESIYEIEKFMVEFRKTKFVEEYRTNNIKIINFLDAQTIWAAKDALSDDQMQQLVLSMVRSR